MLRVCLIGGLRVDRDDAVLQGPDIASRKGRTVLAVLATEPTRTMHPDVIAATLWPDVRPGNAQATLASLVSRLRRTLGPEVIAGRRDGYRLGPPTSIDVDLEAAARLVAEAERRLAAGQPGLANAAARAALDILEAGAVLPEEDDAEWVAAARGRHAVLLRRARHTFVAGGLATGESGPAQRAAAAAVADDPLDEDAVRGLIAALAAAGEVGAALGAYERMRRDLAEQLGADPAPETQRLYAAILRGDPVPDVPRGSAPRPALLGLAGRDAELATLTDAWGEAAAGRGSLVLLTGEPGAGKTRLAEELAGVVRSTGGAVLTARCYEAEQGLFLQPFVDAISAAAATWPAAQIRAAATDHPDALARLVPDVQAALGATPGRPGLADVERRRSIEGVSAFLRRLALTAPLLMVLDDLHNAGRSTIELLHSLRATLSSSSLLIVATVRSDEGAQMVTALAATARRLEVGGLPADAVATLAAAAGQEHRAGEISRRSGGNALFVVEMLRGLAEDTELPQTLQAAVLDRIAGLDPVAQDVLRAGAVLGTSFEPQLAAELAAAALGAALRGCEEARHAGLLVPAGRRYEFANDVLREVAYATTAEPVRLAHHAHAADLLADLPERAAEHAAAVDDWPRAARAWLRAAEQALDRFAAPDAAALAGAALDAARRADSTELTGRALLVQGRAAYWSGAFPEAFATLGAAVQAARAAGDRRLEMEALREQSHDPHVAFGRAPADSEIPLRECLQIAESLGDRTREADVLGRLAILAMHRLDFVAALDLAERALRVGRASGQRRALVFGLDAAKSVHAYLGEAAPLAEIVTELEPLERADGDLFLLQWTVFESFVVPLSAGDHGTAQARVEEALALNRRSGLVAIEPFFLAHLGWLYRLAGDLEAALAIGERAVSSADERTHVWWRATASASYASTLAAVGRAADGIPALEAALPAVDVAGAEAFRLRCLAALAAASGSADALRSADDLLRTIAAPAGTAWLLGADAYLDVAAAWAAQGEPGRAREAVAPLRVAAAQAPWPALVRLADSMVAG